MRSLPCPARRAVARAVSPLLVLGLLFTACDRGVEAPAIAGPNASVQATIHRVSVNVTDAASVPVAGIVVTATDVNTGEYFLALTGPGGQGIVEIPDGSYLVHARNLQSAGPATPRPLSIAPLPDNAGLLPTSATQAVDRLGVLWDPNAPGGSVPLDPDNYSRLTTTPPLILSGPPSNPSIDLQFLTGATLSCTFFDGNGQPVALQSTENVFVILPHGSGPLPPVPPVLSGFNFPRGILLGVTTVPSGQSSCSLAGFNQATSGAVIETNSTPVAGKPQVFVGLVPPASTPTSVSIPLISQPRLATTFYLLDPFGDGLGPEDIGLVTSGWTFFERGATDDFVTTARFKGFGVYSLDARWIDTRNGTRLRVRITVQCTANGCSLQSVSPSSMANLVTGSGAIVDAQTADGAVTWTISMPGGTTVEFNVMAGSGAASDVAPDTGAGVAKKDGGNGNSWIIPGD